MKHIATYKGFEAHIEESEGLPAYCGSIVGINDGVYFEAESASDIENAFHEAVDDYISFCAEKGKAPETTAQNKRLTTGDFPAV